MSKALYIFIWARLNVRVLYGKQPLWKVQTISRNDINLNITINGHQLNQVTEFVYLVYHVKQGTCKDDVKRRIRKALGAVQRLQPIWTAKDIQYATNQSYYLGLERESLRKENDESWFLVFEMMCLRKIMGVTRLDKIRNDRIAKHWVSTISTLNL